METHVPQRTRFQNPVLIAIESSEEGKRRHYRSDPPHPPTGVEGWIEDKLAA